MTKPKTSMPFPPLSPEQESYLAQVVSHAVIEALRTVSRDMSRERPRVSDDESLPLVTGPGVEVVPPRLLDASGAPMEFLTVKEFVAQNPNRTSVSRVTEHVRRGLLPHVRLGKRVLIPANGLDTLHARLAELAEEKAAGKAAAYEKALELRKGTAPRRITRSRAPLRGVNERGEVIEFIALSEFRKRLGNRVSHSHLTQLANAGELPAFQDGSRWMIRSDALEILMAEQEAARSD